MLEKNDKPIHIVVFLSRIFVGVLFSFLFVLCLVKTPISPSSTSLKHSMSKLDYSGVFAYMLQSENHLLFANKNIGADISFSKVLFTLVTNINPSKSITLLGSEIPGLDIYNTEIAIAGKGTNLTNLPFDPPPKSDDDITKERQIADDQNINDEKSNPPDNNQQGQTDKSNLKKVVYIYHTHSWEAFLPLIKGAKIPDEATSTNNKINVVAVGARLTQELINKGIGAEHDTSNMGAELKAKNWTASNAYNLSREHVKEVIAQDKETKFFIDIHRDSQRKSITTTEIRGKKYARIDIIVGKENSNYKENLNYAKELNTKLEQQFPGISRGIFIKTRSDGNGVYNQDLSNRSILLEFGGVDNNLEELYNAVDAFAKVFSEYYWKAEEVNG
ncbi:stage II sporulation protein P [Bacillus sp. FJAT-49736]|uniref:stage II sporulation protein P n=1 Tax=Bacillus sp. FJAT-49736 TaxID=2833582 RepID=UPI001BC90A6F|nr:stage II sporulation protein P [Bacillus sp. FJAT-49736]MBS4174927.1 stage II sporulation protein P [Bacillus sp. FJAT-49736]